MGGGGDDNDESCVTELREVGRRKGDVNGSRGVVMMQMWEDEIWLNKK